MALTLPLLSTKPLPQRTNFHRHAFLSAATVSSTAYLIRRNSNSLRNLKLSCTNEEISSDDMLAVELDLEISRLKSRMVQREEALKKSRELLFVELCNFKGLKSEDLKKKWRRMNEEEKLDLAKAFVTDWSSRFHPLSAKSVVEMIDEDLVDEKQSSMPPSNNFFPNFRKLIGFSPN